MRKGQTAIGIVVFVVVLVVFGIILISSRTKDVSETSVVIPAPTGYVVDTAGVLKPETVSLLTNEIQSFDASHKIQIAVLVVTSTQPLTIEEYGIKVGDSWKVGYKGMDTGVIFILATQDRKTRIEVGTGLEGNLPDSKAEQILQDNAVPSFHVGDWNTGTQKTVEAIINVLK